MSRHAKQAPEEIMKKEKRMKVTPEAQSVVQQKVTLEPRRDRKESSPLRIKGFFVAAYTHRACEVPDLKNNVNPRLRCSFSEARDRRQTEWKYKRSCLSTLLSRRSHPHTNTITCYKTTLNLNCGRKECYRDILTKEELLVRSIN